MRKKSLTIILILSILILFVGSAYSGWSPKNNTFGPIVIKGHPWGDSGHSSNGNDNPPYYGPGSGNGYPDFMGAPTFTNFVLQFYLSYVVKKAMEEQSSTRQQGRSE